jgi:hypothetical protein
MSSIEISCCISTTDALVPLGIEIWLDEQRIFDQPCVTDKISWRHSLSDNDGEHEIRWILKNKTQDHTKLDEQGNILHDTRLIIKDVKFDDIELGQVFIEKSSYCHDFNGTAAPVEQKFYGEMGCNGTVSLKFTTPIYLWLLENL